LLNKVELGRRTNLRFDFGEAGMSEFFGQFLANFWLNFGECRSHFFFLLLYLANSRYGALADLMGML
jgi:hypothetical protein